MLEQTGVEPIQNAVRVVHEMSEDTKTRELARIREKALLDELSAISSAEEKGEHKATFNIARNLVGMNLPIEQIEKATGLSRDEIIALQ